MANFNELIGKTLSKINVEKDGDNSDAIYFHTVDGNTYLMTHYQDCCETVVIKQIDGDINDLIGTPILQAEESTSADSDEYDQWTFYRIHTAEGAVVITWEGNSNGYYSMEASFEKI